MQPNIWLARDISSDPAKIPPDVSHRLVFNLVGQAVIDSEIEILRTRNSQLG